MWFRVRATERMIPAPGSSKWGWTLSLWTTLMPGLGFAWSLLPRQKWGPGAAQTITVPMAAARTKLGSPFLDGNTEHGGFMGSDPATRLSHPLLLAGRAECSRAWLPCAGGHGATGPAVTRVLLYRPGGFAAQECLVSTATQCSAGIHPAPTGLGCPTPLLSGKTLFLAP